MSAKAEGTQDPEAQKTGDSGGMRGEVERRGKEQTHKKRGKQTPEAQATPARRGPNKEEGQDGH